MGAIIFVAGLFFVYWCIHGEDPVVIRKDILGYDVKIKDKRDRENRIRKVKSKIEWLEGQKGIYEFHESVRLTNLKTYKDYLQELSE